MSNPKDGKSPARRPGKQLGRKSKHTFTTKSGQTIKIHRSLSEKIMARKDARSRRRAERLAGMPKSRIKRFFYRLHPQRMYMYWFSREGGIMALKITGIGIIAGFLLLVGIFAYFRKDLPNLKDISGSNIGGSIRYYDKTGQTLLWEDYDAVKRIPVKDENISQYVKDATVAIEDKDFFKHGGFDVRGIVRAGMNNVIGHNGTQGGSTITQQLVKLTNNWTKDQTYTRKVKELILSVELERSYSKKEILAGYLNAAPYGNVQYGVEAASRDYFQKSAKDLTLDEAAFLAAIPKSPSFYSPYGPSYNKEALIGRQHYVLDLMEQQGMITAQQRDEAKKVDIIAKIHQPQQKFAGITAPWFVLTAKEQLEEKFGEKTVNRGGWKVTTTLDLNLQHIAEEQVNKGIAQVKRQGGDSAAFVAEDVKTGQVVALVGGADFSNPEFGQNNYARYRLPPGSSFKPYDYVSLIENTNNFGAGSVLYDTQGPIEGYPCTNKAQPKQGGNCLWDYDFRYPGPVTLRYALGGSRNVPAVKAMLTVGVDKTIETAEKLGLESGYNCYADDTLTKEAPCYASSAIGDGAYLKLDEHVHAYTTISRNGVKLPQTYILKIEDAGGKTVDEWKPSKGEQVIRPDAAYIVADMMSDPNASYFPAGRKPHRYKGWEFAMKTGTTNDGKDGWMMGFSTQYAAGVWVGYHNRQRVMSGTMENMTQPIWQGWMDKAHDNLTPEKRAKPNTVQTLPAFVIRSHVGIGSVEPSPSTDLFPAWFQSNKKTTGEKRTIDIVSNKLATDCTPERARKEVSDADANSFSGDRFVQGSNANTQDKDDIHNCDDVKPSITLTYSGGKLIATATAGTHPLSSDQFPMTINFLVNGQIVNSSNSNPATYTPNFSSDTQVTAQVIDSVLYDATSNSVTVPGTGGGGGGSGGPLTITSPDNGDDVSANSLPTSVNVTWTGGSGPYTVFFDGSPATGCQNINSQSCTVIVTGSNNTSHTIKVTGSSGSDSVTIKK
jgi:penicillin-binding protein 1A